MSYICKKCGKVFENDWRKSINYHGSKTPLYCSKTCANSHTRTKESREKISLIMKGIIRTSDVKKKAAKTNHENRVEKYEQNPKLCKICHQPIEYERRKMTTCEKHKDLSKKGNGGYFEGTGRSKTGYYKGIYCGSTYELVYVIYRLDHNLPVKRFEGKLTSDKLVYVPDFIEGNKITEIKGYWQRSVDEKCKLAQERGYDIEVLYKEDLQYAFDWVQNHYEYKLLQDLYDDPAIWQHEYICHTCGNKFVKPWKLKGKYHFCSKDCRNVYLKNDKERKRIISCSHENNYIKRNLQREYLQEQDKERDLKLEKFLPELKGNKSWRIEAVEKLGFNSVSGFNYWLKKKHPDIYEELVNKRSNFASKIIN